MMPGKVELKGLIEAFNLVDGEGWVEILDQEVAIDENTEIEGTLEVGLMAEVEVVVQPDDSLLATEIEIEDVGDTDEDENELTLQVVGEDTNPVGPGQIGRTLRVTYPDGSPVAGATVTVNDVTLAQLTDGNGEVTFNVPPEEELDEDELEIEAVLDEMKGELEYDLK